MYKPSPAVNSAPYRRPDALSFQEEPDTGNHLRESPDLCLGCYRYFIRLRDGEHILMRCPESETDLLSEVLDHESLGITDHDIMVAVRECPGHFETDTLPVSDHMTRKLQILFR
jgi:hypothetical protein